MTPADRARQILTDATITATLHDTARTMMQLAQPGLPEHTPGASPASGGGTRECPRKDCSNSTPCPTHDSDPDTTDLGPGSLNRDDRDHLLGHTPADHTTATERLATTPDPATRDLTALDHHCRQAAHHLARAATLAIRWQPGVTDADVKTSLQERLDEIWCVSCARAGISTPRRQGRTECTFCADFRTRGACGLNNPNNHPAPRDLLEIHLRRSINSADVTRTMIAAYGPTWNRKIKGGKKGRAA